MPGVHQSKIPPPGPPTSSDDISAEVFFDSRNLGEGCNEGGSRLCRAKWGPFPLREGDMVCISILSRRSTTAGATSFQQTLSVTRPCPTTSFRWATASSGRRPYMGQTVVATKKIVRQSGEEGGLYRGDLESRPTLYALYLIYRVNRIV